jgi:hypothetical protein
MATAAFIFAFIAVAISFLAAVSVLQLRDKLIAMSSELDDIRVETATYERKHAEHVYEVWDKRKKDKEELGRRQTRDYARLLALESFLGVQYIEFREEKKYIKRGKGKNR